MKDYSLSSGALDWLDALQSAVSSGTQSVLVTVLAIKGSTPREPGAKMLVQSTKCVGTIGGGHLEAKVIQKARELLDLDSAGFQRLRVPLGASLGQCCGGHVELALEVVTANNTVWVSELCGLLEQDEPFVLVTPLKSLDIKATVAQTNNDCSSAKYVITNRTLQQSANHTDNASVDFKFGLSLLQRDDANYPVIRDNALYEPLNKKLFRLFLFGAGHVGKAVVQALQPLPCDIIWIDSRADMFAGFPLYKNVHVKHTDDPVTIVPTISPNAFVVVMTHNHQLDFDITEQVLTQASAAYVGLIGSSTKCQRFKHRLNAQGLSETKLNDLICPIGIDGITGKHPSQIALSLGAQLLQHAEKRQQVAKSSSVQL